MNEPLLVLICCLESYPNKGVQGRTDFASASIGYGKGAMLFHMLKHMVGESTFFSALRGLIEEKKFSEASWIDIEKAFEKASEENLERFLASGLIEKMYHLLI